jgi:predicted AlkP superfamily pyrophosphatase or phosphodiesterase
MGRAKPLVVIDVVGLTPAQIGADTPHLQKLAEAGFLTPMGAVLPAVTCSAQATMLTGKMPREHGVVGNGWLFRDTQEVRLWQQSNQLVSGEKIYDSLKKKGLTTAKLFWWYNMYSTADWSVTPRPSYPADGRKIPGIYTQPHDLKYQLNRDLGEFPLFHFWGPTADLLSSRWITDCALWLMKQHDPSLTLVYLPHLDYDHQRLGPDHEKSKQALREVDALVGELAAAAAAREGDVMIVSEYGIRAATKPIDINRALRKAGLLAVQETLGWELLDAGASRALAVADHQIAHVYVRDPADLPAVRAILEKLDGVAEILDAEGKQRHGLDHPRAGELVAVAAPEAWFTYYYWLDETKAPDFAPTVDIHRKPGYDPAELFLAKEGLGIKLKVAARLAKKLLGFRYYMDVISLDATKVRGSHGRLPDDPRHGPVLIGPRALAPAEAVPPMTYVHDAILRHFST